MLFCFLHSLCFICPIFSTLIVANWIIGTGHFTQVVWRDTREVGLAYSEDGKFIVANYSPAGNMTMPGYFEWHVPPPEGWTGPLPKVQPRPPTAEEPVVITCVCTVC